MLDLTANTIVPLALGTGAALLGGAALAVPRLRRSWLPSALLLVGPVVLAALWWYQLSARSDDRLSAAAPKADYRIELREMGTTIAVTDRGRRVRLGTLGRPVAEADLIGVENDHIREHDLSRKVLVRTKPDPTYNCHGWLFTGGRFWVAGDILDDILADNQYTQVSTPSVGDLAVYRGARGEVVHTGVVHSTDGFTLIESKWGPMGRFLHGPDDQPFGGVCVYYHSPRRGHLLNGLQNDRPAAAPH